MNRTATLRRMLAIAAAAGVLSILGAVRAEAANAVSAYPGAMSCFGNVIGNGTFVSADVSANFSVTGLTLFQPIWVRSHLYRWNGSQWVLDLSNYWSKTYGDNYGRAVARNNDFQWYYFGNGSYEWGAQQSFTIGIPGYYRIAVEFSWEAGRNGGGADSAVGWTANYVSVGFGGCR